MSSVISWTGLCTFFAGFSALQMWRASHPIYALLFLVHTFVQSSLLCFAHGVDFLALVFLMIYVGALVMLFLFVIMLLPLPPIPSYKLQVRAYALFALSMGAGVVGLAYLYFGGTSGFVPNLIPWTEWVQCLDPLTNVLQLGQVLFTVYTVWLWMAGLILFVALVAAVLITVPTPFHRKIRWTFSTWAHQPQDSICLVFPSRKVDDRIS